MRAPALLGAALRPLSEKLGASPLDFFRRSKKVLDEVHRRGGPLRLEPQTSLPRHIRQAAAWLRAAGENNAFHFRPDRRQRRTGIAAAIE